MYKIYSRRHLTLGSVTGGLFLAKSNTIWPILHIRATFYPEYVVTLPRTDLVGDVIQGRGAEPVAVGRGGDVEQDGEGVFRLVVLVNHS